MTVIHRQSVQGKDTIGGGVQEQELYRPRMRRKAKVWMLLDLRVFRPPDWVHPSFQPCVDMVNQSIRCPKT